MAEFMGRYDLLLCPAAIVPPFPVETRYLAELNGHRFPSYIDWVTIAYAITLTACPALSLPCGFTAAGLPVGLQMVGQPRGEAELLAAAAMLEDALGLAGSVPIDPRGRQRATGAPAASVANVVAGVAVAQAPAPMPSSRQRRAGGPVVDG